LIDAAVDAALADVEPMEDARIKRAFNRGYRL